MAMAIQPFKIKAINENTIWVLASENNLIKVNYYGDGYSAGKDFLGCSKWKYKENAMKFKYNFPELSLYKVVETKDDLNRLIIKFLQES